MTKILFYIIYLNFLIFVVTCNETINTRIVGGWYVRASDYPHHVFYQLFDNKSQADSSNASHWISCGGSIIEAEWILTSANCVDGRKNWKYRFTWGKDKLDDFKSIWKTEKYKSIVIHPNYVNTSEKCNLAMIQLTSRIEFSTDSKPISLIGSDEILASKYALVTGFGELKKTIEQIVRLQAANVKLVPYEMCKSQSGYFDGKLCSEWPKSPHGPCYGDSGSGLIGYRENGERFLIGVLSKVDNCLPKNPPLNLGYTNVSLYTEWIFETMNTS